MDSRDTLRLDLRYQPACNIAVGRIDFLVAYKTPATNTPVPVELELANREADLPDWASYELAKR